MQEFDLIINQTLTTERRDWTPIMSSASSSSVSSTPSLNTENIVVGIDKELIQLKKMITRSHRRLVIIPVVGMAGIGKTTLAQNLYIDPSVRREFHFQAWVTISQEFDMRRILLDLLKCFGMESDEFSEQEGEYLAMDIHTILSAKKYLIVMDDIWSSNAWDNVKKFLPEGKIGSCVIVTTRDLSVAHYVRGFPHHVKFLRKVEIWNLLRRKVFGEGTCPEQLEEIGQAIAQDCKGLPLTAHVIGRILNQLARTREVWEEVARDVSSSVTNNVDEKVANILFASYNHLPSHLKPCFLYMATFPKNYKIQESKLIKLWVAEGFLKPIQYESLEDVAKVYLKALINMSLMLVPRQLETKGSIKSYIMHDLIRDMCIRKAREENFVHLNITRVLSLPLRIGIIGGSVLPVETTIHAEIRHRIWALRQLRVLDILQIIFEKLPEEIFKLINLRYLALSFRSMCTLSISVLCNLQTIHFRHLWYGNPWTASEASKIFMIPQLRHLKFEGNHPEFYLQAGQSFGLQEDLQTLTGVKLNSFLQKLVEATPNLKKLGIEADDMVCVRVDLTCLSKLETLKCSISYMSDWDTSPALTLDNRRWYFLSCVIFPPSLKKLSLYGCTILEGHMDKIAELPNLEVLKLDCCEFENEMWKPVEGGFQRLMYLQLEWSNLVNWMAEETHYPRLMQLIIQNCWRLEEIPFNLHYIVTLRLIELKGEHRASVLDSARKMQDNRRGSLEVHITSA